MMLRARCALAIATAGLAASCTVRSKDFCCLDAADCAAFDVDDGPWPCDPGFVCSGHLCEAVQCADARDCSDAATPYCVNQLCAPACAGDATCAGVEGKPICSPDGVCVACGEDDECPSGVCRDDGACEDEAGIVHVAPAGVASGTCDAAAPCNLVYARGAVRSDRFTMLMEGGTYSLADEFVVDASLGQLVLIGPPAAVVERSAAGPSFVVSGGASLVMRGLTVHKGLACDGAEVDISRVLFDAGGGEAHPRVAAMDCTVVVAETRLSASPGNGIDAAFSTVDITRSEIEGGAGHGVRLSNSVCSISDSRIVGNSQMGIDADGTLAVTRSILLENRRGGVRVVGGTVDFTNNFVIRNGNDADSTFGGLRLDVSSASRIEHNTIVYNDSDVAATPPYAGGIYCTGASAPNNLVYNNYAGNNTQPNAQVGGTCSFSGSLVANGDGTNEMHFIAPVSPPFDYHVADASSPAVNAGVQGPVVEDFDGQARDASPDVGADEYFPPAVWRSLPDLARQGIEIAGSDMEPLLQCVPGREAP